MMTSINILPIVYHVMVLLGEGFSQAKAQPDQSSHGNQSRDVYYTTTFDQDISRRSRSSTELPIVFKAPDIESQNFWNFSPQGGPNRRTFFEDFKYLNYGNSNVFPNLNSFFEFMSPLFDRERTDKAKQPVISKPSEPYKYEYPFKYLSSTERNFLPPPKPLRASIVKLETLTKPPDWHVPFRYIPPADHLTQPSHFQTRPTEKLPSLSIDELGFHSDHTINFRKESNWLPQNIPGDFPTTEPFDGVQPTAPPPISTQLDFNVYPTVTPKIRQDPLKNDVQSNTFTSTPEAADDKTKMTGNLHGESEDFVPTFTDDAPDRGNKNHESNDDSSKKTVQLVISNTVNKYNMINNLKLNRGVSKNTVSDNAEGAGSVTNVKPNKSNIIKIVTDLTLESLQKNKKYAVNVPRYTKLFNMSNLISYELNKLEQNKLLKPRSDADLKKESHTNANEFVNNDDLSLDLKILKDTNWDGFSTESVNKYFPGATEIVNETKQVILENENKSSKTHNIQNNNSISNLSENKENTNNETIIVETRVTKSVSKLLPGKKLGNHYQGKGRRDPRKEGDITKMMDSDVLIRQPNLQVDVFPEATGINGTDNNTFTTEENQKMQKEEGEDQTFNKTVITLGKKFDVVQEYSSGVNQTFPKAGVNYRSRRRKYRPFLRNRTPYNSSTNTMENTPIPTVDITEQKDESLNSTTTTYIERTTDSETSAATETSWPRNDNNVVGTQHYRKKPRTSKSKKRRTGRRRKTPSTTEKQVITEESTRIL